jgi:hypothetical protein
MYCSIVCLLVHLYVYPLDCQLVYSSYDCITILPLFICLCIHFLCSSVCPSVRPFVCLTWSRCRVNYGYIFLSVCLLIYMLVSLSLWQYICLSIYLTAHLSVHLSVSSSLCLSIFVSATLSIYPLVCMFISLHGILSGCPSVNDKKFSSEVGS